MGVAGDGKQCLDSEWKDKKSIAKSCSMSAKVAWGKSTGYADQLCEQGMETSRAQQLENWINQQELQKMRTEQRYMTKVFYNKVASAEEDWWQLSKFGMERNQKFDLDQTLQAVTPGSTIYHHIQLQARLNWPEIFEFNILVRMMGTTTTAHYICVNNHPWQFCGTKHTLCYQVRAIMSVYVTSVLNSLHQ